MKAWQVRRLGAPAEAMERRLLESAANELAVKPASLPKRAMATMAHSRTVAAEISRTSVAPMARA